MDSDQPFMLNIIDPPLGSWRGSVSKPSTKYAQPAHFAAAEPFSVNEREQLTEWLNEPSSIQVSLDARTTPIDLLEMGDILRMGAAVSFCTRIYNEAISMVRLLDPNFQVIGTREHVYLTHYVSALLDDPKCMPFRILCDSIFMLESDEYDDREDLASFIADGRHEDNGAFQRSYGMMVEAASRLVVEQDGAGTTR